MIIPKKILAVSSSGGHWDQLMLIRDSFSSAEVFYVTTLPGLAERNGIDKCFIITDSNQNTPGLLIKTFLELYRVFSDTRPDVVVTTGAAPGLIGLIIGRIFGAKTIWIDSIANSEKISLSGRIAEYVATVTITQWEHLSAPKGPKYLGGVL